MNRDLGRQAVGAAGAKPAAEGDEVHHWQLPDMNDGPLQPRPNAFGIQLPQTAEASDGDSPEIKPLTAEELDAMRDAAHAEGVAEGRLEGLRQGHEEGFAAGREEGLAQGHELGLQQGLAAGQRQIDDAVAAWERLARQLEQPLQQVDLAVEQQLLQLVVNLARAVIRCELVTNERLIHALLNESISGLPLNTPRLQVSLNPEDRQLVDAAYGPGQLQERGWTLMTDAALGRGHCVVKSDVSRVEINPEQDVKELLERFLHQRVTRIAPDSAAPAAAEPEGITDAAPEPPTDSTI